MTEPNLPPVDCYAVRERGAMAANQRWRERWLAPLLARLALFCVRPDHITLLSLISGLAFIPVFFVSPFAAFCFLGLHVLLDGLDGPLARFTGVASRKGSFTDTMADQIVVAGTTIVLMKTGILGAVPGGLYLFVYTLVLVFAFVRNALAVPYSWLVRPRLVVYAWLPVETYLQAGTVDYVVWGGNAVLAMKLLTGFVRIRRKLGE